MFSTLGQTILSSIRWCALDRFRASQATHPPSARWIASGRPVARQT
jgi:hypothetical protein